MSVEECTTLLESHDIARMGAAADEIRARRHPDNIVTYIIDRNVNYTNVCNVVCTFCAFYRRPGAPDTYVRTFDEICKKIDETIALGGTGVLMQGGLHPDFGIEWYEDLLRSLREVSGISVALFLAAGDSQHPPDLETRLRNDHGATERCRDSTVCLAAALRFSMMKCANESQRSARRTSGWT